MRKHAGPLTVFSRPNDLGRHRLGLSVSRRVGGAVVRTRLKRMLREAFRLNCHAWPGSYDLVVVAHRHDPADLERYAAWLKSAAEASHRGWHKRRPDSRKPSRDR
jgi:ribonuclease P protein component